MNNLLLDTNIISYRLNQHSFWQLYQPHLQGQILFLAAQTVAELRFGAIRKNWGSLRFKQLENLILEHQILHSNDDVCSQWAWVKVTSESIGQPMGVADAWIAATALAFDIPLVTHNKKHFDFLPNLRLISENHD